LGKIFEGRAIVKYIERATAQQEFDRLLATVDNAKGSNDPEVIENAAKESLIFISKLSGNEIAKWLMQEAQESLPETPYIKSNERVQIGSSSYIKRGLARLILTMSDVLDAAHMSSKVLARDLIEMSHEVGSNPALLSAVTKGKGRKDNRDLKYVAKKRVAEIIHYEAARNSQSFKNTLFRLNNTLEGSKDAEGKAWERIEKMFLQNAQEKEVPKDRVHPDVQQFRSLWQQAMM
jgi:hypothetical protein